MSEGAGHDFLGTLARDTGGRVFLNTNDLGSGLVEAVRDADSYYLVGYEPLEAGKKGSFRAVKMTTTRPNVTLRYRRGYYAMSDRERASADVDVAMRAPAAFARAGFVVSATTVDRTLQIDVRIPSTAIRIRPAGANERATFAVHAELHADDRARTRQDAAWKRRRARAQPRPHEGNPRQRQGRRPPGFARAATRHVCPHRRRPRQRRLGRREHQRADCRAVRERTRDPANPPSTQRRPGSGQADSPSPFWRRRSGAE